MKFKKAINKKKEKRKKMAESEKMEADFNQVTALLRQKRYKDVRPLGIGSFGVVVSAQNPSSQKVAFKWIPSRNRQSADIARELFFMTIVARQSEHITPLLSWEWLPDGILIEMPLATAPLWDIRRQADFTLAQFFSIVMDVLCGLSELHQMGLLHLDLKPENILFFENKQIKLADFGLAELIGFQGGFGGTNYFRDPVGSTSKASDMWALGIMVLVLLYDFFNRQKHQNLFDLWDVRFTNLKGALSEKWWAADITNVDSQLTGVERGMEIYKRATGEEIKFPNDVAVSKLFEIVGRTLYLNPNDRASANFLLKTMKTECPLTWQKRKKHFPSSPCSPPPTKNTPKPVLDAYHTLCNQLYGEKKDHKKRVPDNVSWPLFFVLSALYLDEDKFNKFKQEFCSPDQVEEMFRQGINRLYSPQSNDLAQALFEKVKQVRF